MKTTPKSSADTAAAPHKHRRHRNDCYPRFRVRRETVVCKVLFVKQVTQETSDDSDHPNSNEQEAVEHLARQVAEAALADIGFQLQILGDHGALIESISAISATKIATSEQIELFGAMDILRMAYDSDDDTQPSQQQQQQRCSRKDGSICEVDPERYASLLYCCSFCRARTRSMSTLDTRHVSKMCVKRKTSSNAKSPVRNHKRMRSTTKHMAEIDPSLLVPASSDNQEPLVPRTRRRPTVNKEIIQRLQQSLAMVRSPSASVFIPPKTTRRKPGRPKAQPVVQVPTDDNDTDRRSVAAPLTSAATKSIPISCT